MAYFQIHRLCLIRLCHLQQVVFLELGYLRLLLLMGGGVIANALIGYTESIDIAAMIVEAVSMRMPLYLLFLLIVSSILSAEVGR
ncbi:hypothetical protein CGSMWGv75712_01435 [Gardnerella vaginalis 75712]|nr:hypothetical protein CGSMWGv75712_01435 [Gardnerella vaginalis 75712]